MRFGFVTLYLLALTITSGYAAESPKIPALVMNSPDSASANYEDKCSNGRNIDKVNRDKGTSSGWGMLRKIQKTSYQSDY